MSKSVVVNFYNGTFCAELRLDYLMMLPLRKIRKLFELMINAYYPDYDRNLDAVNTTRQWLKDTLKISIDPRDHDRLLKAQAIFEALYQKRNQ